MITQAHVREILQHDANCRGIEKLAPGPQVRVFTDKLSKFKLDPVEFSRRAFELVENLGPSKLTLKHLTDLAGFLRQEVVTQERLAQQLPSDQDLYAKSKEQEWRAQGLVKVIVGWDGKKAATRWVSADRAVKLGDSMSILRADFLVIVYGQRATQMLQDAGGTERERLDLVFRLACDEANGWTPQQLLARVKAHFGYQQPRRETQVYVSQDRFSSLAQQVLAERGEQVPNWHF